MKKIIISFVLVVAFLCPKAWATDFENQFTKPLSTVLNDIEARFGLKLKYDIDTAGLKVPYADFRIRPYSAEESLTNVLSLFDYKFIRQGNKVYKLKNYEYMRRTQTDGEKMLEWLNEQYADTTSWNARKVCLKKEVRENLKIDEALAQRVNTKPVFTQIRKYDGYSVQNFYLETLPGLYVNGSVYMPQKKGRHSLILCPNGHWGGGRYNRDEQIRFGVLARMGAICVSYDLFAWGESELQVGAAAHRTSVAHIVQIMNGLTILDYMLTRKDVDASYVGVNGGSGGGSQVVLLTALDDRFTAACPVVSLASHFDGGCPCESGMPVSLSCGGTNNAELMAMFAPKPLCVVSDGGDWTASVPELEFPYLQRIYRFYNADDQVANIHLPDEKHDFGINKRRAVYAFFASAFGLDTSVVDERAVTVEPVEAMLSFGDKGEKMPANAIRDFKDVEQMFDKNADRQVASNLDIEKKAAAWVGALNLSDKDKENAVKLAVSTHLKAIRDWHNDHPYTIIPEAINPQTGTPLTKLEREMIADSSQPASIREKLMRVLKDNLTEAQIEQIFDGYTVGKVAFTMQGYKAIVPDLTAEEEAFILKQLKQAREEAIGYKSMNAISGVFEIYKTKCEQYLNANGRDWRQMFKDYVNKRKAEKAAENKN